MSNEAKQSNSLLSYVLWPITILGGIFLYNKTKGQKNSEDQAQQLVQDEPTRQASLINYYIGSWYQKPNVPELINIARTIKDWPAVVSAYSRLYKGENLEEAIRTNLQKWGGYTDFLNALSKRGLPGTNTDNIVVQPKQTVIKKGDKLFLDDSKYNVVYFRDWRDYPVKPLATVPKGKIDPNRRQVTFVQAYEASYAGSPVKTTLYQVTLSNGQNVWVNRDRNIAKKAQVKGTEQLYGNII